MNFPPALFGAMSYALIAHGDGNNGAAYITSDGRVLFTPLYYEILWCLMLKRVGENENEFERVSLFLSNTQIK